MNILRNVCGSSKSFVLRRACGQELEISFPVRGDARVVELKWSPFTPSMRLKVQMGLYGGDPTELDEELDWDKSHYHGKMRASDGLVGLQYEFNQGRAFGSWKSFDPDQQQSFDDFLLENFQKSANALDFGVLRDVLIFPKVKPGLHVPVLCHVDKYRNDRREALVYDSEFRRRGMTSVLNDFDMAPFATFVAYNKFGLGSSRLTPEFEEYFDRTMVLD